jgi:NAD(P)-dependent dehydrogenase (short-subunit alcohol dehydrogenase family)
MSTFKDSVVLVTGGTSGIGRATAVAFAKAGAKVVVSGRRAEEGQETVRRIEAVGGTGLFVQADVSKDADVARLVRTAVERFGRVDVAFNNAGVEEEVGAFHEKSEAVYDKIFDINVKGLWLSMVHEVRQMLRQGGGVIVNTSSIAGVIGFPGAAVYDASKHAVIGFTKSVALEYARKGIRVNAVAPAAIDTDMFSRFAADDAVRKQLEGAHPVGRIGKADEVAAAVLWLASDAASFVTGQTLPVDGGYTAQ